MHLREIFKTENPKRDKYLSRVFGIFSEEIASLWIGSYCSPYINRGRPTLSRIGAGAKSYTMDFTLQEKAGKKIYIAEMKCELEYDNYRYLELVEYKQLDHHKGEAFSILIDFASNPQKYKVTVSGKDIQPHGSILIWGAVTDKGRNDVLQNTNLREVLSLETMINDLLQDNGIDYKELLNRYAEWTVYLFEKLGSR